MNRTIAPEIISDYHFEMISPKKVILSNGIEIYYIEGGSQDVAKIELLYKAGSIFESTNMLASFANDLIGEGTTNKTSLEIHEAFDIYGAYLQKESTKDYGSISVFSVDEFIPNVLPILLEVITESNISKEEFEIHWKNRKSKFIDSIKKVDVVCRNEFMGMVFGNHPYGRPVRVEDFEYIHRDIVFEFYQTYYQKNLPTVFVVGNVSETNKKIIENKLSHLTGTKIDFPDLMFNPPPVEEKFIENEGAIQSAIRIGRITPDINHKDYPTLNIANTILGGYFGSRLMKNIREEKGYTYGIGSGLVGMEKSNVFFITTEVGKEVTADAIREIYHEIEILQKENVSDEELSVVKNYILGNFIKSLDGPFNQVDKIKTTILKELDSNFYIQFIEKINKVTSEEIKSIANKYWKTEDLIQLVVGSK